MAKILILGAGVMGSALTIPASDNANDIVLVGTHLDRDIIHSINQSRHHPTLDAALPETINAIQIDDLIDAQVAAADVVILGVSSVGVAWAVEQLARFKRAIKTLALVTKGLEPAVGKAPQTYAHTLPDVLNKKGIHINHFVGIGGPCIAREIVFRQPTSVVYASSSVVARNGLRASMQTPSYRVYDSEDIVGVEACAALKNFLAIGVSAMISRHQIMTNGQSVSAKNPVAAAFNQAVHEMAVLTEWIGGDRMSAFDHAGMGDLHVTVGGGRNSRLGVCLGEGLTPSEALNGPLAGQTVEGKDTGMMLAQPLHRAIDTGKLGQSQLPLTLAVLRALQNDSTFEFDFQQLG